MYQIVDPTSAITMSPRKIQTRSSNESSSTDWTEQILAVRSEFETRLNRLESQLAAQKESSNAHVATMTAKIMAKMNEFKDESPILDYLLIPA